MTVGYEEWVRFGERVHTSSPVHPLALGSRCLIRLALGNDW